jgi:phage-related protein
VSGGRDVRRRLARHSITPSTSTAIRLGEKGNAATGLGPGVYELVDDHRGDTYRAVYTLRIAGNVHVLHAFQKKSKSGIKTPKPDADLIERRLKAVLARYGERRS